MPLAIFRSLPISNVIVIASPRRLMRVVMGGTFRVTGVVRVPMLKLIRGFDCLGYPSYKGGVTLFKRDGVSRITTGRKAEILNGLPLSPTCTGTTSTNTFCRVRGPCLSTTISTLGAVWSGGEPIDRWVR